MSEQTLSGGTERFSTEPIVQDALGAITNEAAILNDVLSSTISNEYDGLVIFSHVTGEDVAVPVGHADAQDIDRTRHAFRNTSVLGRSVLLRKTALGEVLKDPRHPRFHQSGANRDYPQFTYTYPLTHQENQVGAVQYSLTPTYLKGAFEHLSEDTREIERSLQQNQPELDVIAAEIAHLQTLSKELGSLGAALEYEDPIAPNSFIIRWDIEGSKMFAASVRRRALKAYLNQAHLRIRELAEAHQSEFGLNQFSVPEIYDDQGDGANIILPIPDNFDTYDSFALKDYRHYAGDSFMQKMDDALAVISNQYRHDLNPQVKISGEFGYTETNSIGRLTSNEMFKLGSQKTK